MQASPSQSPPSQGDVITASSQPVQSVTAMTFSGDLMLDSGLYPDASEAFLYEDQFMQDLPWSVP